MTDAELNALYPNRAAQIRAGNVIEASGAGDRQRESDRRKAGPWYKNTAGFDNPATWASLALLGGATVPAMFSAGGAGGAAGSGGSAAMGGQLTGFQAGLPTVTGTAGGGLVGGIESAGIGTSGLMGSLMPGNGNPFLEGIKTLGGGVINAAKNLPWGDVAQTAAEGLFARGAASAAWKRQQEAFNKELYLRRQQMEIERGMNRRQWLIDRPTYQTRNFARAELGRGIGMDPATQQVASAYEVDPARIDEKVGTIGQMYNL